MNSRIKLIIIASLIVSCFALTSCNTVRGFGYDVQNTGRVISGN